MFEDGLTALNVPGIYKYNQFSGPSPRKISRPGGDGRRFFGTKVSPLFPPLIARDGELRASP
jgi:hypothetical protein